MPATAANQAAGLQQSEQSEQPPGPQPGSPGFVYGREENRAPGESYVSQVSRERREASGDPPPEETFVYGREENRRPGESYVSQVSREKKGDTAPPPDASSSDGVYTEDRPQDQAAAERQSNMVGDRRMGDYGRRENRREDESHSDQVTREYGEDRDARREQREDRQAQRERFDPMSRRRQEGESREEFRDRKELVESFDQKAQEALRNGDTTLFGKGYVPVLFSRADNQRKVLIRLDVTHSTVIEGAVGSERGGTLPAENSYYLGGGGGNVPPHPWQISFRTNEVGEVQAKVESASSVYSGLGSFTAIAITGLNSWTEPSVGYVIVEGEVSTDGTVTSQAVSWGMSDLGSRITFNEDTQTKYRFPIAYLYINESGSIAVRQLQFTNKTLVSVCVDGKSAVYPISA